MIKQFTFVKTKSDKTFHTPKRFVKGDSYGYVVDILNDNNKTELLVEINDEIYEYNEAELEIINTNNN